MARVCADMDPEFDEGRGALAYHAVPLSLSRGKCFKCTIVKNQIIKINPSPLSESPLKSQIASQGHPWHPFSGLWNRTLEH